VNYPVSATQLDKFGCPRRWAWEYVCGFKEERKQATSLGSELHDDNAAPYLMHGRAPDESTRAGALFKAGLKYLPPPGAGGVEGDYNATISGIGYRLIMDWFGPSDLLPKAPKGLSATLDHKTSKNPRKYGLWGDDAFLTNVQSLLYLAGAIIRIGHTDGDLFARWLYYHTGVKNPRAVPSDATLPAKRVVEAFGDIVHPRAYQIVQLRQKKDLRVLDLPYNLDKCKLYPPHGCPHKHRCTDITPLERFRANSKENNMGMLDDLRAATQGLQAQAAPPPPQAAPPVAQPAQPINPPPQEQAAPVTRPAAVYPGAVASALRILGQAFVDAAKAFEQQ